MSDGVGLLNTYSVPKGGFLYTYCSRGEGFCSLQVMSGGGWFWMKLIPALRTSAGDIQLYEFIYPKVVNAEEENEEEYEDNNVIEDVIQMPRR